MSFCENLIEELRQIGKIRTTETYTTTLNSFKRDVYKRQREEISVQDDEALQLQSIYEIGTSAGGQHPKALSLIHI